MRSKAYATTSVDWTKSRGDIQKLLEKNDIKDVAFSDFENNFQIIFLKNLEFEGKRIRMGVKLVIPNMNTRNKNQLHRALFYYLKAKFESLDFGFVEEYNEAFVKEFMPYLVTDRSGKTVSDLIIPKFANQIESTEQDTQLYLESKEAEKA